LKLHGAIVSDDRITKIRQKLDLIKAKPPEDETTDIPAAPAPEATATTPPPVPTQSEPESMLSPEEQANQAKMAEKLQDPKQLKEMKRDVLQRWENERDQTRQEGKTKLREKEVKTKIDPADIIKINGKDVNIADLDKLMRRDPDFQAELEAKLPIELKKPLESWRKRQAGKDSKTERPKAKLDFVGGAPEHEGGEHGEVHEKEHINGQRLINWSNKQGGEQKFGRRYVDNKVITRHAWNADTGEWEHKETVNKIPGLNVDGSKRPDVDEDEISRMESDINEAATKQKEKADAKYGMDDELSERLDAAKESLNKPQLEGTKAHKILTPEEKAGQVRDLMEEHSKEGKEQKMQEKLDNRKVKNIAKQGRNSLSLWKESIREILSILSKKLQTYFVIRKMSLIQKPRRKQLRRRHLLKYQSRE
jgi:hypothetical protein